MKLFPEILLGFVACLMASVCEAQQTLRVMEYNVENLFDCRHDSLKNDSEQSSSFRSGMELGTLS